MALTFTRKFGPFSAGSMRAVVYEVQFDSAYASGGEAFTAANVGLSEILHVAIEPIDGTSRQVIFNFDYANAKLQAYFPTGGDQAAPTSLADPVVAVTVPSGSTTVTSSAAQPNLTEAVTPGVAKEVGAADLSSVKVRAFVWGF